LYQGTASAVPKKLETALYQGTASAVPKKLQKYRALAPEVIIDQMLRDDS
jgi:hypothetical protein